MEKLKEILAIILGQAGQVRRKIEPWLCGQVGLRSRVRIKPSIGSANCSPKLRRNKPQILTQFFQRRRISERLCRWAGQGPRARIPESDSNPGPPTSSGSAGRSEPRSRRWKSCFRPMTSSAVMPLLRPDVIMRRIRAAVVASCLECRPLNVEVVGLNPPTC